ncbi:uncharacterized protein T551_00870 [Pneumocystis jirovecii RU7]|uniref:Zn(2)-C6 fungal-type domain-containing protein n=1 Tax=Pneumocystis jirovecii (strain RU7) TaxID=1408657 RepID=A0A0W4ZUZ0_PNEJ7|nr:uncharacterized protein T551_00870 [Pneumocystis jirovecii RU7]KTW32188.1 hypothetical protein T551_00870 [Pneumocystis jirovecii RU7]
MVFYSACETLISQNITPGFLSINKKNTGMENPLFKTRTLDSLKFPYRSRSLPLKGSDSPRQRIDVACQRCRRRKIRCSGDQGRPDGKCTHCIKANYPCEFVSRIHPPIQIPPILIAASPQSPNTVESPQPFMNTMSQFPGMVSPNLSNFGLHETPWSSNDPSSVTLTGKHPVNQSIYVQDAYGVSDGPPGPPYSSPFSRTAPPLMGLHSYLTTKDPSIDMWASESLCTPLHDPSPSVVENDIDLGLGISDQYLTMPHSGSLSEIPLSFDLQTSQFWSNNALSQFAWTSDYNKDTSFDSVPVLSSSYDASSDSAWDSQSPITDLFPNNTIDVPSLDGMFCFIKDLSPTPVLQEDNSSVV